LLANKVFEPELIRLFPFQILAEMGLPISKLSQSFERPIQRYRRV